MSGIGLHSTATARIAVWLNTTIKNATIIAGFVALAGLDAWMGTGFYARYTGRATSTVTMVFAWSVSLGTSAIQIALWTAARSASQPIIKAAAATMGVIIVIADTAGDVSGAAALNYGAKALGDGLLPPHIGTGFVVMAAVVAALCVAGEPFIMWAASVVHGEAEDGNVFERKVELFDFEAAA